MNDQILRNGDRLQLVDQDGKPIQLKLLEDVELIYVKHGFPWIVRLRPIKLLRFWLSEIHTVDRSGLVKPRFSIRWFREL